MIPAPFTYRRARTVEEALDLATEAGDEGKFLAGGHSLLPLMKLRFAVPEVLIDIGRLAELSYIRDEDGHIAVGALARHHELEHAACDLPAGGLALDATLVARGPSRSPEIAIAHFSRRLFQTVLVTGAAPTE